MPSRSHFCNLDDYKNSDPALNGRFWAQVTNGGFHQKAAITRTRYVYRPPPTNPAAKPHRLALFDFIIEIEMTAVFDG